MPLVIPCELPTPDIVVVFPPGEATLMSSDEALWSQNLFLFGINVFGVYRYLIRKKPVHD